MLSRIRMGLRSLFDRRGVESEMEREMRLHVDMETEANIRRGMSPEQARRAAVVAFGGAEKAKEATRDQRATRLVEQLLTDFRYALRGMRHRPGFTTAVVLLLALGIGANTAIYSVVAEKIIRVFPVADGNRMVSLVVTANHGEFQFDPPRKLADVWASRTGLVEQIRQFRWVAGVFGDTLTSGMRELTGLAMSPGMMSFMSMRPAIGRDILPADTVAAAPGVVILSDSLWRVGFGARNDVIGSAVPVNGEPFRVIGVAPRGFFVPFAALRGDYYVALRHEAKPRPATVIGKVRAGHSVDEALREAAAMQSLSAEEYGISFDKPTLKDGASIVRPAVKRIIVMVFGAVGIVLLIACANVANLLLARTWSRQREFAVRGAMGAGRARIMRQLFTENLLLSLLGGVVGFVVAAALVKAIVVLQPDNVGIQGRLDWRIFGWAMMTSLLMGVLLAIAPLGQIADLRLNETLKSSARSGTASRSTARLRASLVVVEVSLSVILLVGSGLLIRSIAAMQHADSGIDPVGLASLTIRFPGPQFKTAQARSDAARAIVNRVRDTPSVEAAVLAFTGAPDFAVNLRGKFELEGAAVDSLGAMLFNNTTEGYFRTVGTRFLAGRPYAMAAGPSEIVINERFARRFWPSGALGRRIRIDSTWTTIVGVVENVDVPGSKRPGSGLQFYQPLPATPSRVVLTVRSAMTALALQPVLAQAVQEAAPGATTSDFRPALQRFVEARADHRFTLGLVGAFAGLALLLAGIGLTAVIGYSVSQRMREIGIRVALGAQSSDVTRLVLGQGVVLAVIGVGLGSLGGLAATRLMRSMLFGVTPGDPVTMVSVAALLVIVSIIACALPARRATRVDPVEMVRAE
jgi:putative ABC transport system permease protein